MIFWLSIPKTPLGELTISTKYQYYNFPLAGRNKDNSLKIEKCYLFVSRCWENTLFKITVCGDDYHSSVNGLIMSYIILKLLRIKVCIFDSECEKLKISIKRHEKYEHKIIMDL